MGIIESKPIFIPILTATYSNTNNLKRFGLNDYLINHLIPFPRFLNGEQIGVINNLMSFVQFLILQ